MSSDFLSTVLATLRVTPNGSGPRLESRSGAGVQVVRTVGGQEAFLKVTPCTLGAFAVTAARRELRFYREVAPVAPVPTPKLLGHVDDEDGVAILLEAAGETRPVRAWTASMWSELGQALARLHDMPLPSVTNWDRPDSLREAIADPDVDALHSFWSSLPELSELLARRATLWRHMSALSPVFIHGDCHTENIPVRSGRLIFCDWQVSGLGRPTTDLAFVSVRATPHGAVVPSVFLDSYVSARSCDPQLVRRAVLAEELAFTVFLWPPYAAFNDAAAVARVRRRTRALVQRWLAESAEGAA
jgi:aminoglycoside phosphotransferase (APT) family kinase protein